MPGLWLFWESMGTWRRGRMLDGAERHRRLREETRALAWSPRSAKRQLREGQGGLGQRGSWVQMGAPAGSGGASWLEQEQKEVLSRAEDCHPQQRLRRCSKQRHVPAVCSWPQAGRLQLFINRRIAAVTLSVCAHVVACLGNNTSGKTRTRQAFDPVSFVGDLCGLRQNKLPAIQAASGPPFHGAARCGHLTQPKHSSRPGRRC